MSCNRLFITVTVLMLIFAACRKEWTATEEDLTNYGWSLYEQGLYDEARDWFSDAVLEDLNYQDGYNGLGWTEGKRSADQPGHKELKEAIKHFKKGLELPQNQRMIHIVAHDILAGLTFAYSGLNKSDSTRYYGDSLITLIGQKVYDKTWFFPHDSTTNYKDVHIELALAYFLIPNYGESLNHVNKIREALDPPEQFFFVDTLTLQGQYKLAEEMERLQSYLKYE